VRDESATETEEPKFDAAKVEETGGGFVEDVEVGYGVLLGTEFFDDEDVFACTPDGVDGDFERDLAGEKKGEFGEKTDGDGLADVSWGMFVGKKMGTLGRWD